MITIKDRIKKIDSKYYWENGKLVRIYVDMDNVLCDYSLMYEKMLEKEPDIKYPQSQYKFFEDLEPILDAVESYKKLSNHYDMRILTAPSIENRLCYTEKANWVFKYFGLDVLENLNISCDKSQFDGQFLIDDLLVRGVSEFNHDINKEHIHFGSKYFPNWETVLKYLLF